LHASRGPADPERAIVDVQDPSQPVAASPNDQPNAIEVQFANLPVNFSSVVDRQTFVVARTGAGGGSLPGLITSLPGNRVRWVVQEPLALPVGNYSVTLVGDGDPAIVSQQGTRLDGEPNRLPSGDGTEGGSFAIRLRVS
jgi:hypothetical protein